ncbi:hypothetical protein CWATWH8502_2896 [Crocosphaera watsonii WH 8502]|uniref:Uncharacterized protein n=2 Tax=Crocosphaera watsonii TaxID=263511 RepID=T2IN43_CROWT|nr:hypothetical protein CWATWH8502_2896 [Crocosphaera watsonii WH 8502]CCQ54458.1 hypothetical protein CWATWH0005_2738 [Crocosphaera watsonii WH 0005]
MMALHRHGMLWNFILGFLRNLIECDRLIMKRILSFLTATMNSDNKR